MQQSMDLSQFHFANAVFTIQAMIVILAYLYLSYRALGGYAPARETIR